MLQNKPKPAPRRHPPLGCPPNQCIARPRSTRANRGYSTEHLSRYTKCADSSSSQSVGLGVLCHCCIPNAGSPQETSLATFWACRVARSCPAHLSFTQQTAARIIILRPPLDTATAHRSGQGASSSIPSIRYPHVDTDRRSAIIAAPAEHAVVADERIRGYQMIKTTANMHPTTDQDRRILGHPRGPQEPHQQHPQRECGYTHDREPGVAAIQQNPASRRRSIALQTRSSIRARSSSWSTSRRNPHTETASPSSCASTWRCLK